MNYDIYITAAADADLNKAVDYIDHILLNPQAVDDLLDEAEKQINISSPPCPTRGDNF